MKTLIHIWQQMTAPLRWYFHLYRGRAWYTKTLLVLTSSVVGLFLWLGMVDINFLWLFGKTPGFGDIMKPPTFEASEIYSADGQLIGKFYKENRTPVAFHEVSRSFWEALIDTEDERFYSHHGIDFRGIGGAMKDAVTHRGARGASTLTQQLAKNMFHMRGQKSAGLLGTLPGLRMLITKSKEWIIAIKLELVYDKRDILTMYANTVDFGNNSFGIKTAAKNYFNVSPAKLSTEQAALLVGMLKATTYYNPVSHPDRALQRRNVVLANMVSHGTMTQAEYDDLSQHPIRLDMHPAETFKGQAQYFREAIAAYLDDWAMDNDYDLYSSGLKIYTTIDTRMQRYAEQAATRQMQQIQRNFDNHWGNKEPWRDEHGRLIPNFIENIAKRQPFYKALQDRFPHQPDSVTYYLNKPHRVKLFDYAHGTIERTMSSLDSIRYMVRFMHCAMVAMEPQTGAVRAWVGDIDFNSWKYDKVTAQRQPGSTFKLFVYTEAMNQGLTPCDKRRDEYISMQVIDRKTQQEVTWAPANASGHFSGDSIPLKSAFARSINSVAVRLGQEMGIRNIIKTAHDMGIKSPLEDEPSLSLGSGDVNLLEMTNAYCTVANDGRHHDPVLVTCIKDKEGNEVYLGPSGEHKVLPYKTAFFMQQLLKAGVNEPGGTSQALNTYVVPGTEWGGKTGTTNNHSDAWFVAVSPKLVVGAWVGGEYRSIHFRTAALGQGSRTALPICGQFIASIGKDRDMAQYRGRWPAADPMDIEDYMYDCSVYQESTPEVDSLTIYEQLEGDEDDLPHPTSPAPDMPYDEYGNPIVTDPNYREEPDEEPEYNPQTVEW